MSAVRVTGECVWLQKEITVSSKKRGCHLITDEITKTFPEMQNICVGLLHIHSKNKLYINMLDLND